MHNEDGLTARQRQVLGIIRKHVKARNLPPSRSEIAGELGLTHPSAVTGHLNALEKGGWVETFPSIERGIRLLREGAPLYEDPADLLDVDAPPARHRVGAQKKEPRRVHDFDSFAGLFEDRPDLFLRITDDSMEVAGYRPGAIVVVVRDLEPEDGDVVVARAEGTVLVRRYQSRDADTIELRPESSNPEHETLEFRRNSMDLEIVGVVVGKIVAACRGGGHEEEPAPGTE